jgi:quercetin dioxygenase-like cupin family protein
MHQPLIIAAALFALSATPVAAQSHHHLVTQADSLAWKAGPGSLPPGAQFVVMVGDPGKDGPYILRLKFPAGYKIPAHTHPNDENVTVISGTFHMGMGGKFDDTKGQKLKAGGLAHMPKGTEHFAWVSEDTVIQLHGVGPAGVTYVNPADDPRKR